MTAEATQARPKWFAGFVALEVALGFGVASGARLYPAASPTLVSAGSFCALAAGLATLLAIHLGLGRGTPGLFAGISVGFLLRTVLLGLGFVATGARAAPFEFVLPFFLVYAATQVAEIVYVVLHNARGQRAKGGTASQ